MQGVVILAEFTEFKMQKYNLQDRCNYTIESNFSAEFRNRTNKTNIQHNFAYTSSNHELCMF